MFRDNALSLAKATEVKLEIIAAWTIALTTVAECARMIELATAVNAIPEREGEAVFLPCSCTVATCSSELLLLSLRQRVDSLLCLLEALHILANVLL